MFLIYSMFLLKISPSVTAFRDVLGVLERAEVACWVYVVGEAEYPMRPA